MVAVLGLVGCVNPNGPSARTIEPVGNEQAPSDNPFVNAKLWLDPHSVPRALAQRWKNDRPEDAAAMAKIAPHPTAAWIGDWTTDVGNYMRRHVTKAAARDLVPLYVLYNIPKRDCGQYSAGGASAAGEYRAWISKVASGIGGRKAVVILEPDGLPLLKKCLSPEDQKERTGLIKYAVATLAAQGRTYVYLDAGHSDWVPADEMAVRLRDAGIAQATGFALNTSNYKRTEDLIAYGKRVSALVGNKPFVIDTGRNGNGPPDAQGDTEASWCNPDGRALGTPPTAETGDPLVHAFLWVKPPGESDGTCNGGPRAGVFWEAYALGLAKRAKY